MDIQIRVHILRTFVTHLLFHMHQKKKFALEIAADISSENEALAAYVRIEALECVNEIGMLEFTNKKQKNLINTTQGKTECSIKFRVSCSWNVFVSR